MERLSKRKVTIIKVLVLLSYRKVAHTPSLERKASGKWYHSYSLPAEPLWKCPLNWPWRAELSDSGPNTASGQLYYRRKWYRNCCAWAEKARERAFILHLHWWRWRKRLLLHLQCWTSGTYGPDYIAPVMLSKRTVTLFLHLPKRASRMCPHKEGTNEVSEINPRTEPGALRKWPSFCTRTAESFLKQNLSSRASRKWPHTAPGQLC
jgi:hypothetical protein